MLKLTLSILLVAFSAGCVKSPSGPTLTAQMPVDAIMHFGE